MTTTTEKAHGTRCAGLVRDEWHSYPCTKRAHVHVDGKDWCSTHSPLAVRAKREAREVAKNIGRRLQDARSLVARLERDALTALRGGLDANVFRDTLLAADYALQNREREARENGRVSAFYWGR